MWIMAQSVRESRQVFVVNIGRDIQISSWTQYSRQVSHPGAKLQDSGADKWLNRVRHPLIESAGERHCVQDLLAGIFVDMAGHAVPDDREEGVEGVNQADLFALVVCAPTVADWHFVNTCPPFCKLDREFRLKPESVARQGNT